MIDAIGIARIGFAPAEVEVTLARMPHRPAADAVVEVEQAGLVLDLGRRLGWYQPARRGGGIGACVSPGPWRMKPPGPTERYWMVLPSFDAMPDGREMGATGIWSSLAASFAGRAGTRRGSGDGAGAAALGAGAGLGAAAFAGAAAAGAAAFTGAFFSFSSPARTGEGRDSRPRRCALPITALRLTPPNSSAIWLAVDPSAHIALRRSIRSSVQLMKNTLSYVLRVALRPDRRLPGERPDSIMDTRRTR